MSDFDYQLVIIGGGPGGYVAAIRAGQLGLKTACIDDNSRFGGTCARVGCIPSKALLETSHHYAEATERFKEHGISVGDIKIDIAQMMARKTAVVDRLTGGVEMLLKKNKVTAIKGRARFDGPNTLIVTPLDGPEKTIRAEKIIIATGSQPMRLKSIEYDDDRIGDSTAALNYPEPPEHLVVIGAGYIGLELGSVWARLGSKVTVLEALDRILPGMDDEIAKIAQRIFEKQGLAFRLGTFVEKVALGKDGKTCEIAIKDADPITADRVLVAVGRVPATRNLGLEKAGVTVSDRGFVAIDEHFQTSVPNVYAIGDCVGGAMLAHKASEEAIACVERIATGYGHIDYGVVPGVCYTNPEIATVGQTEEQLRQAGIAYKKGMSPFGANGRALTLGDTDGRVKILADQKTDRVLGVHIIGPRAGDLIAEAATAMSFGATSEDIARTCHAHPTLAETLHEAALAVGQRAIHS